MAALFAALTGVGSLIAVPLSPVPITLQTLFVYLAGTVLGSHRGALSQALYLILGSVGLPIFAGGGVGFGTLIGPTGGYLIGFIVSAFVIGKLVEVKKNQNFTWILLSISIGTLIIYLLGMAQLSLWLRMTLFDAFCIGVLPFLIADALKILLAALITVKVYNVLGPLDARRVPK